LAKLSDARRGHGLLGCRLPGPRPAESSSFALPGMAALGSKVRAPGQAEVGLVRSSRCPGALGRESRLGRKPVEVQPDPAASDPRRASTPFSICTAKGRLLDYLVRQRDQRWRKFEAERASVLS
jgi:hypothetical protein